MKNRLRKKNHKKYLDDVALEISQASIWRKRLFQSQYNEFFLVTYERISEVPIYLRAAFSRYKLKYKISKVKSSPEYFDEGLIIFKIEAADYEKLVRYSGNNDGNQAI